MKFCQIDSQIQYGALEEQILVSGFYQWHRLFEGEIRMLDDVCDRLEDYDVLFVGMNCPTLEARTISRVRTLLGNHSETKIVSCVDYPIETWKPMNLRYMKEELSKADHIFAPEPMTINWLSRLLGIDKRSIPLIPHPTDTKSLKTYRVPQSERVRESFVMIHACDNNYQAAWMAMHDNPLDADRVLLNGPVPGVEHSTYFPHIRVNMEMPDYLKFVSRRFLIYDSYQYVHTYGRMQVEAAVLQVPCIGTDTVYAQKLLWPALTTESMDITRQHELVKRLCEHPDFYEDCVRYAADRVEQFGYDGCRNAFTEMITDKSQYSIQIEANDETEIQVDPAHANVS